MRAKVEPKEAKRTLVAKTLAPAKIKDSNPKVLLQIAAYAAICNNGDGDIWEEQ